MLGPLGWTLCVLTVIFLFMPVVAFLRNGWRLQKEEIFLAISGDAVRRYFGLFRCGQKVQDDALSAEFEKCFHSRHGRLQYLTPALALGAVAAFLLGWSARSVESWLAGPGAENAGLLPPLAVAAVAGAYMWVVSNLIERARRRNFSPSQLLVCAFRFLVAAPLAFALTAWAKAEFAVPVAFLLGVFPTNTLMKVARRNAGSALGLSSDASGARNELESLQGVNTGIAEGLQGANVETVVQLAYSDPIDLTIRTNFSFSFVLDCCSQALARLYLGDQAEKLPLASVRGAQEIWTLIDELDGSNAGAADRAKATLDHIASKLDIPSVVLERTFREVAEDPYTLFITDVWCS